MELLFALVKDISLSGADLILACGIIILYVKLSRVEGVISKKLENGIASALAELTDKVNEMHGYCRAVQQAKAINIVKDLECVRLPIRGKQDE